MAKHSWIAFSSILIFFSPLLPAQTAGPIASNFTPLAAAFTIQKNVNEVNLVFTTTDSKGHLQNQLGPADFRLLDNHLPPEAIRYFQHQSDLPLRVGILIDSSDSIASRMNYEKKAAGSFLKNVLRRGVDSAFVVAFDNKIQLLHDFSDDAVALSRSLAHVRPAGYTRLYDALIFAANKLRQQNEVLVTRRVLVVISDGADTASHALMHDVQDAAVRADTTIFALSTNDVTAQYPQGEAVLELLSRPTGGHILPAREENRLKKAFAQLEETLRSQYTIGYIPAAFQADGTFHSVELLPLNPKLRIQCRRGYFAEKR
jgi:Ca-activated chloride channel family protein